jgi:lysozyme
MTPLLEQTASKLKRDEGRKPKPYQDTRGIWTVGYGTNLTSGRLSEAAMTQMLMDRLQDVETACLALPIWTNLSEPRKGVLLNIGYHVGFEGLMRFRRMLQALEVQDYPRAAAEILDSDAAREVGARYDRLAKQMETDTWT